MTTWAGILFCLMTLLPRDVGAQSNQSFVHRADYMHLAEITYQVPDSIRLPLPPLPANESVVDEARKRRTSPVLKGVILGGLVGGLALSLGYRLANDECDDTDSFIPCEANYVMLFGVGFVPGALVGGLIGAARD